MLPRAASWPGFGAKFNCGRMNDRFGEPTNKSQSSARFTLRGCFRSGTMTTPITCPDAKQLQDLLEGRLSGGSEVELVEHLNQCDSCPRKLETMAEGGMPLADSVKKLSREVPSSDSAYWAQLRQIRQELRGTEGYAPHL